MSFLRRILQYFSENKKEMVYAAFTYEDYFRALNNLKSNGIKFKVKNLINHSSTPNPNTVRDFGSTPVHYEFYVKKFDYSKASKIIHDRL